VEWGKEQRCENEEQVKQREKGLQKEKVEEGEEEDA
jgi:hypothetical protein